MQTLPLRLNQTKWIRAESLLPEKDISEQIESMPELQANEESTLSKPQTQKLEKYVEKVTKGEGGAVVARLADAELSSAVTVLPGLGPAVAAWESDVATQLYTLETHPDAPSPVAWDELKAGDGFFEGLNGLIEVIQKEYLGIYQNAAQKYSQFNSDFKKTVLAAKGDWIKAKNDGKDIEISSLMVEKIKNFLLEYKSGGKKSNAVLYPPYAYGAPTIRPTHEQALRWAQAMDLPISCLQYSNGGPNSYWKVLIDFTPLEKMRDSLQPLVNGKPPTKPDGKPLPGETVVWDSAKYQAWDTGFNSQVSELDNKWQMYTTKYSNANAYYGNFNELLSSLRRSLSNMLLQMAGNI